MGDMDVEDDDADARWLLAYTQVKQEVEDGSNNKRKYGCEEDGEDVGTRQPGDDGAYKRARYTAGEPCVEDEEAPLSRDQALHDAHVALSQQFCNTLLNRTQARVPHCRPEQRGYNATGERMQHIMQRLERAYAPAPPSLVPLLPREERDRKGAFICKSAHSPVVLQFQFANFVTVTYLGNAATGGDYSFNLYELLERLLGKGTEYRRKKFAKANVRLFGAGSMMIYASGIIVESGCDCTRLSRRMMQYMLDVLRNECGYRQLYVQRRLCFNIVATGNMRVPRGDRTEPQPLCLALVKKKFPRASYKKDKFKGVIIKLVDLEQFLRGEALRQGHDVNEAEYSLTEDYAVDDDESEFIAQLNAQCEYADSCELPQSARTGTGGRQRHNRKLRAAGETASEEADARRNATLDEFAPLANSKSESGTYLIFKEGQVIYTGCRLKQRVFEGYDKIYALLLECLSTPENCAKVSGCDCGKTRK